MPNATALRAWSKAYPDLVKTLSSADALKSELDSAVKAAQASTSAGDAENLMYKAKLFKQALSEIHNINP